MKVVSPPRVETFPLLEWDPEGDTTITVREHRAEDTRRRAQLWERQIVEEESNLGIVRRIREDSLADVMVLDCYLTFVATNLQGYTQEPAAARTLFYAGMDETAFFKAFGQLPDEIAYEWHSKVLDLNPEWAI